MAHPIIREYYGVYNNSGQRFFGINMNLCALCSVRILPVNDATTEADIKAFRKDVYNELINYPLHHGRYNQIDMACINAFFKPHPDTLFTFIC